MPPSLFKFVLKFSLRDQIQLLCLTAVSLPFIYFALDVPKLIINDVLGQSALPDSLYGLPLQVDHTALLGILSGLFLVLVCVNGAFKYLLNVYRGVVAERMLRRLRYTLFSNLMRFPLPRAQQLSPAETVPLITAETEPLGGYIGDALALPAFQGGLLATYTFFIMVQDPILGLLSLLTFPIQAYVTPRMQKRVNRLARKRVLATRRLAADIGDAIGGVADIHAESNSLFHRARIADRLGTLYGLRFDIYKRKFAIKFINSFLNHVTPFFFYLFGGWLVLNGELTIGALVAALAAFREMASPWRELLKFYQQSQDAQVKYDQIVEQFQPADLLASKDDSVDEEGVVEPAPLLFTATNHVAESGRGLSNLDGRLETGCSYGLTEDPESGADELCRLVAQQLHPKSGTVTWRDRDWFELGDAFRGAQIAYVGNEPWLFDMSLLENLRYGCFVTPRELAPDHGRSLAARSGNTTLRPDDDWIADSTNSYDRLHAALQASGSTGELIEMGMRMPLSTAISPEFEQSLLDARADVTQALAAADLGAFVQQYDPTAFATEFSIGENLLFAVASTSRDWSDEQSERSWINALTDAGLLDDLLAIGVEANRELVEMFAELPDNHRFFTDFGLFEARDLPEMQRVAQRVERVGTGQWVSGDRWLILSLVLSITPAKHRVVTVDPALQKRIVDARESMRGLVGQPGFDDLESLDPAACSHGLSIFQNAVFGVLTGQDQRAHRRVRDTVFGVLDRAGLATQIVDHALKTEPGPGGRALRSALRQKLALARALIKPCPWLVVNRALDALDVETEAEIIRNVLRMRGDSTLLWSTVHAANTRLFPYQVHLSASGAHRIDANSDMALEQN